MKPYRTLTEIKKECRKVSSTIADSDAFMYKCFPYFLEQLTETNKNLVSVIELLKRNLKKKKRKPTEYNLFIAKQMKSGKSLREAVENWKKQKNRKNRKKNRKKK